MSLILGKLFQFIVVVAIVYFLYLFLLDMHDEINKKKEPPSIFDNANFELEPPPMKKPKDDYQKFRVRLEDGEVDVYFRLSEKISDVGWGGSKTITYKGRLKDEATLDSEFYIFIYEFNGKLSASPCNFDENKTTSFLQMIVTNNEESVGVESVRDIFSQIKKELESK